MSFCSCAFALGIKHALNPFSVGLCAAHCKASWDTAMMASVSSDSKSVQICREQSDVLSVGCWDGTLSHYSLSGEPVGTERQLGFDPCCVSYMPSGMH